MYSILTQYPTPWVVSYQLPTKKPKNSNKQLNRISTLWLLAILCDVFAGTFTMNCAKHLTCSISLSQTEVQLLPFTNGASRLIEGALLLKPYSQWTLSSNLAGLTLSRFDFKAHVLCFCISSLCWVTEINQGRSQEAIRTRIGIFFFR